MSIRSSNADAHREPVVLIGTQAGDVEHARRGETALEDLDGLVGDHCVDLKSVDRVGVARRREIEAGVWQHCTRRDFNHLLEFGAPEWTAGDAP